MTKDEKRRRLNRMDEHIDKVRGALFRSIVSEHPWTKLHYLTKVFYRLHRAEVVLREIEGSGDE
jgi:hypothetical protein